MSFGATFLRESIATLRAGTTPFRAPRALPTADPRPGAPPAILVHGFLGHPEMFHELAVCLLESGCPEVRRVHYSSFGVDFDEIISRIDAEVRASYPAFSQVDLIGHSLGAIACRAYIKTRGGAANVRRFVAIAAPFHGTSLYRLVPGPLRPALDPRGPWVARLNASPEPRPTTVVRARYDTQVVPADRASLGGEEIVVDGCGHNGLLWSDETHRAVVEALR